MKIPFLKYLYSNNKRSERMKKNIAWGFVLRGIGIVISLLLVPMTINYVSSELYGVWLTLSTIIHWISFFDIGFGMGLRNKLGVALAEGNAKRAKILVSSTYAILTCIFVPLSILFYIVCGYLDWALILNVSQELNPTLISSSRIVVVSFCFTLIMKVIQNVLQAYQMNALGGVLDTISHICTLIAIFVLTKIAFPSLEYLALAFSTIPVFTYFFYSLYFYTVKNTVIAPTFKCVRKEAIRDVFGLGGKFFFLQISFIILFQTTNILISQFGGSTQVTLYNVTTRYMGVSLMVLGIVMAPVWSAMTDAYAKKDYNWMKSLYKRLMFLYKLGFIAILILLAVSPIAFKLWLGDSVETSLKITALVGLYSLIRTWHTLHATLINGMGIVKLQMYVVVLQLLLFPFLAYFLGRNFSLVGIILSNCIVIFISGFTMSIQARKVMRQNASGIWLK